MIRFKVIPNGHEFWDGDRRLGSVVGVSLVAALDAMAACHPTLAAALDALRADDLCGETVVTRAERPRHAVAGGRTAVRKAGSGARFRELILAGSSNAEALAAVRAEFPESKATLSDAAWNRARLREGEWNADGTKKGPGLMPRARVDDLL